MDANFSIRKERLVEWLRQSNNGEVAQLLEDYDYYIKRQDEKIARLVATIDALVNDPKEDELLHLIAGHPSSDPCS
jgi:hypothetical protein